MALPDLFSVYDFYFKCLLAFAPFAGNKKTSALRLIVVGERHAIPAVWAFYFLFNVYHQLSGNKKTTIEGG